MRDAVDVEIGGDLHARAAGPDHGADDIFDLLAQPVLVSDLALVGARAVEGIVVAGAVGEQLAAFVDDRDTFGLEPVDRARHQVTDGADLGRLQRAIDLEDDGGGGVDLVAGKQLAFRQHQMHTGGLDPVEAANGAGEFAFECAQVIDVLDESGGAERVGLVENFVADAAAFGQAGLGELHAQPTDILARYHDSGAVAFDFIGDGLALEVFDDRR